MARAATAPEMGSLPDCTLTWYCSPFAGAPQRPSAFEPRTGNRDEMPELPEVETVRRGLEPVLAGQRIARLDQRRPDLRFPLPPRFAERLAGRRSIRSPPRQISGRPLDSGDTLVMHLGMSGRFTITPPPSRTRRNPRRRSKSAAFVHETGTDPAHDHIVFHMASGATVTYNDPRRFGFMDLVPQASSRPTSYSPASAPSRSAIRSTPRCSPPAPMRERPISRRSCSTSVSSPGSATSTLRGAVPGRAVATPRLLPASPRQRPTPTERCHRLVVAIREYSPRGHRRWRLDLEDYAKTDGSLGYFQHSSKSTAAPASLGQPRLRGHGTTQRAGRSIELPLWEMPAMINRMTLFAVLACGAVGGDLARYRPCASVAATNRTRAPHLAPSKATTASTTSPGTCRRFSTSRKTMRRPRPRAAVSP